jgi:hypothetical protein
VEAVEPPRLRVQTLLFGLAWTSCGWLAMGLSLWALIQGIIPEETPFTWEAWGRSTAFVALAYVAGFLTLPTPGGLGTREFILRRLLTPELALAPLISAELAGPLAAVVVLWLRLLYIITEVLVAGAVSLLALALVPRAATASSAHEAPGQVDHGHPA